MKKTLTGLLIVVIIIISIFGYFFLMKDESKVAQVVIEDKVVNKITQSNLTNLPPLNITSKSNTPEETIENKVEEVNKLVKYGSFIKIDALHHASGDVKIEKAGENYKIKLQSNFSSANGPDLYVYLSEKQNFKNIAIAGVDTSKTLNIGKLQNINGEQEYLISKNDFEKYNAAVIIWCKQFGVQFSRADLK